MIKTSFRKRSGRKKVKRGKKMKRKATKLLCAGIAAAMLFGSTATADAAGLRDIFDAKYYAGLYPDLKAAFGDDEEALYQHFFKLWSEGRQGDEPDSRCCEISGAVC